jgi:hypothetical protein
MKTMSTNELSRQERTDDRRAEWERFSMTVLDGDGGGYVNVRNDSHDNPGEHIHSVHVEGGSADGCSCPHAVHRDAHCKHQRAVEKRPLVLASADAASASANTNTAATGQQVATDGGTQQVAHTDDTTTDDTQPQTDHWGQPVDHYDDAVGAGEKSECQACGSRFEVALVAATAETSHQWEEFYRCQNCNAGGSFRVDETQPTREAQRTWTGMMAYPDA